MVEAVNVSDVFDEVVKDLNFNLDDNPDDILTGTVENDEPAEAEDEPEVGESGAEDGDEAPAEDSDEDVDPNAPVVEVPAGSVLRLPDGTTVDVDKAVLLQSDYTRKTQQLAEERKQFESERELVEQGRIEVTELYNQMRGWYEERSSNPTNWVQEIVENSEDPTATIAKALYELANKGKLDPAFVQTFGIDAGEVAERAKKAQSESELDAIRRKMATQEHEEIRQRAVQEQVARYQSEWAQIKQERGLAFDDVNAENAAKKELLQFAVSAQLTHSLKDAYDLMLVRTGRAAPATPAPAPSDPEVTAKKRASRAVAQKSVGGGSAAKTAVKKLSTREAALAALDEFSVGAR